jgi:hypothetical protein
MYTSAYSLLFISPLLLKFKIKRIKSSTERCCAMPPKATNAVSFKWFLKSDVEKLLLRAHQYQRL